MALWPDSVELAGVSIALADVLADVTMHHGRSGVFDDPSASTCQVVFYGVGRAFVKEFAVGQSLAVTVRDDELDATVPRFSGLLTDATLDGAGNLTAIAVSRLSTLGRYKIGGVASWPVEPWSARVGRLFVEAGIPELLDLRPDPEFDPPLAGRNPATAGETSVGDYLTFLAPMIGAAVADQPDGTILVQAIGSRSLDAPGRLDPAYVEYAPAWEQVLPGGNIVTVRYTGDQSESVTVRDDHSVALYGELPRTIDTSFTDEADATRRAQTRLARGAYAHWNITETPVLVGLALTVGEPVELSSLPPASPYDPWTPFVEGWTDTITGDDWRMAVALSDPLASGLVLPWNAVPAELAWNTIDQAIPWREALTLGDLVEGI